VQVLLGVARKNDTEESNQDGKTVEMCINFE
jgi:hypothetical protein